MLQKENLYFIAIIPSAEICAGITSFKQEFADRFFCKAALKVIPHITLKAPFKLAPSEHAQSLGWFQTLAVPARSFIIELHDFGVFPKKPSPVIFIQPVMNEELNCLQMGILESFKKAYPHIPIPANELAFNPHITIAYRDLGQPQFTEAWKEYSTKKYRAVFEVNDFQLLQHDGRKWQVIQSATFHVTNKAE